MAKKQFVIFPFNGNGIEALDCIDWDKYEFLGFIDDDRSKAHENYKVFSRDVLTKYSDLYVLAVPGSPQSYKKRSEVIYSLNVAEKRFFTVIHQNASIGKNVKIGINSLIMAGVVLTSNVVVGSHVCILPNTVIHHDTIIGNYTLIGSNVAIAGGCTIGNNCYIGSGTNIMNGMHVGSFALAGLGSNIISHVEEHSKMVGNPARNLNTLYEIKA